MIDAESSVIMATQLKIAPATIPLAIIGVVIRKKVFIFEAPKLIAASSVVIGICWSTATLLRIVYGVRRIHMAIIIIAMEPVSTILPELKVIASAMPTTEPGII